MYYPYLRGKQFELVLLREQSTLLRDNHFHPIIEPVKQNLSALKRTLAGLIENNVEFTLVINPQCGELIANTEDIYELAEQIRMDAIPGCTLGYIVGPGTDIQDVVDDINANKEFNYSVIHYGYIGGERAFNKCDTIKNVTQHIFIDGFTGVKYRSYFDHSKKKRILIRDGFRVRKNARYPTSEHFTDLHLTFQAENYDGFGDFLIIGEEYQPGGGPAHAVAIHLSYLDEAQDMHVMHFISDRIRTPSDPGGKFLEALTKLVAEVDDEESEIFMSDACEEYVDLYNQSHFPGLGYVKKLSMQHHIELIAYYLS